MNSFKLLNPGPVNVSTRVRAALQVPDLCHREPEVRAALQSARRRLVRCFGGPDFAAVVLTGSGTLAVEAMIAAGVARGPLLVGNNGVYGQRMADMARAHGIPVVEVTGPWTTPLPVADVESALLQHPEIEAVALVHHETTTGLLNPVAQIGALCRRYGKRFLLDSVSGLGGEAVDLLADGVDLCAGTANKCLQGLPGISFVLARRAVLEQVRSFPRRSVYLDLPRHFEAQERDSMLFTMAVQVLFAFEAALAELEEETVSGRVARYRQAAIYLRDGFARLGLQGLLPPEHRSNTLTAVRLPPCTAYPRLHDALKARGFIIYEGQGRLQAEIFRVANMGALRHEDFAAFLEALPAALAEATQPR